MTNDEKLMQQALDTLIEARDGVESWGSYASDYFRAKHNLAGQLSRLDEFITTLRERLAQCVCGEPSTNAVHRSDGPCYQPERKLPPPSIDCVCAFTKWYGMAICEDMDIQTQIAWDHWQIAWNAALSDEKRNQCGETCERARLCPVCCADLAEGIPDAWRYKNTERITANTSRSKKAPPGWVPLYVCGGHSEGVK